MLLGNIADRGHYRREAITGYAPGCARSVLRAIRCVSCRANCSRSLSLYGALQYGTRGPTSGPRGYYCSVPSRRWYLLETVEAHQPWKIPGALPWGPSRVPSRQRSSSSLILPLSLKCGSRTPGLEFCCRIVSRGEGYRVSWVPLGFERVACMTAAYLETSSRNLSNEVVLVIALTLC